MKPIALRTYLLVCAVLIAGLTFWVFGLQAGKAFHEGFSDLDRAQLAQTGELVRSAFESRRTELENLSRILRSDNDLASKYLLAKEGRDYRHIKARLETIRSRTRLDVVEILASDGKPILTQDTEWGRVQLASQRDAEGLVALNIQGKVAVVSFAPLRLYDDPVGVIALGYFLDGAIQKDLANLTKSKVIFHLNRLGESELTRSSLDPDSGGDDRVLLELMPDLMAEVSLREDTSAATGVRGAMARRLLVAGALSLVLLAALLFLVLEFGFVRAFRKFSGELQDVAEGLEKGNVRSVDAKDFHIQETNQLSRAFAGLTKSLKGYDETLQAKARSEREMQKQQAWGEVASMVSHDIRSPLLSLELAMKDLSANGTITEAKRSIVRDAMKSIQELANQLLEMNKLIGRAPEQKLRITEMLAKLRGEAAPSLGSAPVGPKPLNPLLGELPVHQILPILESALGQKRYQYQSRTGLDISLQAGAEARGIFVRLNPVDLNRLVSNLVENAARAIKGSGKIELNISGDGKEMRLIVKDTGSGIPASVLPKLMQRGATFGGHGGSGIGLYQARMAVESWGGTITIRSEENRGTEVEIRLPLAEAPAWYVDRIQIPSGTEIAVVDDDALIHAVWKDRFSKLNLADMGIRVHYFDGPDGWRDWVARHSRLDSVLHLVDYEFSGNPRNGLDYIEETGLARHSILVTGRGEDADVVKRCERIGVRIIMKSALSEVEVTLYEGLKIDSSEQAAE